MGIFESRSGDLKSDRLPVISHPLPTTFTPNPPADYDIPLETTSTKKLGLRGWIKSRSGSFWIVTAFSLLLIVGLAISLPLFLRTRHVPSLNVQSPETSGSQGQQQNTGKTVPHSFLIDIASAEDEKTRAANRMKVIQELDTAQVKYTITRVISSPVYNGFRITVKDDKAILDLGFQDDVLNVWPVSLRTLPQVKRAGAQMSQPQYDTQTQNKFEKRAETQITNDNSGEFSAGDFPFYPPHALTGVDKLHSQEVFGEGIIVGVIDTGVDYTHPALGGCFGQGCKIGGGTDLVGNAYDGQNNPQPDDDPLDQCNGHGTHVSGIILADARNVNASQPFIGVAPSATIFMYRVFGCNGSSANDVIIDAMARAFADGVQIISMSLGGLNGWSEDPEVILASRLADRGVFMSIAAGNDGSDGLFAASSPAAGPDAMAVASVDAGSLVGWQGLTAQNELFDYFSANPMPAGDNLPIYITAKSAADLNADACNPLPDDTPDLSQFVVLTKRGTCLIADKTANLEAKNATRILIDNAQDSTFISLNSDAVASSAIITFSAGQQLRSNPNTTLSFPSLATGEFVKNNITGGFLSTFTSWGPTNELAIKPNVAAPGGIIYSTFPLRLGGFEIEQGTSMATPYISGVVALYLSVKGQTSPLKMKDLMTTTANPIDWNDGFTTTVGMKAPVAQQGGGLVNAFRFISATTEISPSLIELNDTVNFQGTHMISVTNNGADLVTYNLATFNAATGYTLQNASQPIASFPPPLDQQTPISVSLSPSVLSLAPGTSGNFTATFSLNSGFDPSRVPVYSGYITVSSSAEADGGVLTIPFMGVAADMTTLPLFNDTNQPFTTSLANAPNGTIADDGSTVFTMQGQDDPVVEVPLTFPTRVVRVDVLPVNLDEQTNTTFAGVNILGNAYVLDTGFPRSINGDNTTLFGFPWDGTFNNGSQAPDGQYRLSVRALKMLAINLDDQNNWETFVSSPFTVKASKSGSQ